MYFIKICKNFNKTIFEKITDKLKQELLGEFDIKYTTRAWSAKKYKRVILWID
ncbi:hypothetical protein IO418_000365 [Campylobacter lari]|nr:hypothetical protein [Campylobacter lari]EJV0519481.1 hypothetical protein [Campylobacter lari]